MKKIVIFTFAVAFVIGAVSAFACGNDNGAAKAKTSASTAEVKQIQASTNTAEAKVQTAQATVDASACHATKTDQAMAPMEMNSDQAKAINADIKTVNSGCSPSAACPATCCKAGKNAGTRC